MELSPIGQNQQLGIFSRTGVGVRTGTNVNNILLRTIPAANRLPHGKVPVIVARRGGLWSDVRLLIVLYETVRAG